MHAFGRLRSVTRNYFLLPVNWSINPNYNSYKKTGIIAKIFEDHWNSFYLDNKEMVDKYRPNAPVEFQKIIDCHNKNLGYSTYECPNCDDVILVGNTCKSRACTSCGYEYKNQRIENILQHAFNCKHKQIVFTIPKEMRIYFFNFEYMDLLFQAVNIVLDSIIHIKFRKNKNGILKSYSANNLYKLGFYSFLHTFGRNIKWNPHIHVLIAEKILNSQNGHSKNINYFNYDSLSKRFQKVLLDLMKNIIPKKVINKIYNDHKKGFYVYAEPKNFPTLKDGIEYVSRYCGRPCISENRIIKYDGKNITFWYNAHEDESYHEVTVTAYEFITMLLRHDLSIIKSFNHNPYDCPNCFSKMNFLCVVT